MIVGQGNGVTPEYLAKSPTRIQAAVMFLRLKGLEKDAVSFVGAQNFSDSEKAGWDEGKNIMSYLKMNPQLGWIGRDDGTFDPTAPIRVIEYYKVMLEALGYKQNVDYKWENVMAFAASKGLSKVADVINFSIDNLATATVEALKAVINQDNRTLIQKLADANPALKSKATDLGLLTPAVTPPPVPTPTPTASALAYVDLTAKTASSLAVKFNVSVPDTSKVTINITRDAGNPEGLVTTWNPEKTEATLTKGLGLIPGAYLVSVTYDNNNMGTKTIIISNEKIAKIEIPADVLVKSSDTTGDVTYKVSNQYGDDISTSPLAQSIKWSTSGDSVMVNTTSATLTVTKNGTPGISQLKDIRMVVVTGYDTTSGVSVSKSLAVADGYGFIKDFKFKGIYNKDGKTDITTSTLDRYFIDYTATDINGNPVDSYSILSNQTAFMLISPNPNIQAHIVRDPDNLSKAKIEIDTHTADGTAVVTGIAVGTGKQDSITVTVKRSSALSQFILKSPATDVPVNEKIDIPYIALDQNGNSLTRFEDINGKVNFVTNDAANSLIVAERGPDGTFKLTARFNAVRTFIIMANIPTTSYMSQLTIDTKPASVPTMLYSVNSDIIPPYIVANGQIKADFKDNAAFTLLDQNNREISLKDNNVISSDYYYVNVTSSDTSKVMVFNGASVAYKETAMILAGGSSKGAATITFELCKDNDNDPTNGKTVISSKSITITNIDKSDVVSYEFKPVGTLYANPLVFSSDIYSGISKQKQEYAADITICGKAANGSKVALNPAIGQGNDILMLSISDQTKFNVDTVNKKLLAKTTGSDSEATDKLVATIQGANSYITTISIDVKSSKSNPLAQSIDTSLRYGSSIIKSGDTYSASSSVINSSSFVGREMRRFSDSGNDDMRGDITFNLRDQYGEYALNPAYFALTRVTGTGTLSVNPSTGLVTGYANSGDQYNITAVTVNGLTKIITLIVQ